MTPRLALLSAPLSLEERYGDFVQAASTEPSFSLVCLAAAARAAGATVRIIEAAAGNLSVAEALAGTLAFKPDIVGLTATTAGIAVAGRLAQEIKAASPSTITVIGGCHATSLPTRTLNECPGFDLVVMQEGEQTLAEIIARVTAGSSSPSGIAGTAERKAGSVAINPARAPLTDLDALPLPAWDLLPGFPEAFHPSPSRLNRWPCASVVLTRGCPNQCTFCDRSVFGHRCRAYSPAYAVRMLKQLRETYGVREILIEDDTFVLSPGRVSEFCESVLHEELDITWSCLGRVDRVDPDMLALMRKAGCWQIAYGVESGAPQILQAVKKNIDLEQVRQALEWTRSAGLRSRAFFMMGLPGETPDTLQDTHSFIMSLPLDDVTIMFLTPFPGSEMYGNIDQAGTLDADWQHMNTLEPVFVPNALTKDMLLHARARSLRGFYMRPSVIFRHALHVVRHPRLVRHAFNGLNALHRSTRKQDHDRSSR